MAFLPRAAKALELDNNLAEAHSSRAIALSAAQQIEEAQAEFETAIAVDPNSFEAHFFYARLNFATGKNRTRRRAVPACSGDQAWMITSAPVCCPKFI